MDEFPHKVRIVPIFGVFFVVILNNLLNNNQVAGGLRRRGAHVNVVNLALSLNVSPDLVLTSWLVNDNEPFFNSTSLPIVPLYLPQYLSLYICHYSGAPLTCTDRSVSSR